MHTTTVNTVFNNVQPIDNAETSTSKLFCVMQAKQQNKQNEKLYDAMQLDFANKVYDMCTASFIRSRVYINLRSKFISIKVSNVSKLDLMSNSVAQLQQYVAQYNNITVKYTNTNSIIFNINF